MSGSFQHHFCHYLYTYLLNKNKADPTKNLFEDNEEIGTDLRFFVVY